MTNPRDPLAYYFPDDGSIPNNPDLAVLIYPQAIALHGDPAVVIEHVFQTNGWPPQWRNGIYDYHHYHPNAHEVLGIAAGQVKVRLGGESGKDFDLQAGDVVVLPAGTGHKCLEASDDLLVIGAYPPEGTYNLCRGEKGEHDAALNTIPKVPVPASDPVLGMDGGLVKLWKPA